MIKNNFDCHVPNIGKFLGKNKTARALPISIWYNLQCSVGF